MTKLLTTLALKPLEQLLNLTLRLDPQSTALLEPHIGKTLAIVLQPMAVTLSILITATGVKLLQDETLQPATTLTGTPLGFIGLCAHPSFTANHVQISGEVDFAQICQQLLFKPEIDWEEQLAKLVGDIPAHTIYQQSENAYYFMEKLAKTLVQNTIEYLQEETYCLPSKLAAETFSTEVDALRARVDRLQARIKRLNHPS